MRDDLLNYVINTCCAATAALLAAAFISPDAHDEAIRGCWVLTLMGCCVTYLKNRK